MMVCQWASTYECFEKAHSLQLQESSGLGRPDGGRGAALYRWRKVGDVGTPFKGEGLWREPCVLTRPEKEAPLDAAEKRSLLATKSQWSSCVK